jgi:hypothetical protein
MVVVAIAHAPSQLLMPVDSWWVFAKQVGVHLPVFLNLLQKNDCRAPHSLSVHDAWKAVQVMIQPEVNVETLGLKPKHPENM